MNKDEKVIKIRDYIYEFLHFDKLSCHILSKYYNDSDMVLEFQLDSDNEKITFLVEGNNIEIMWYNNRSIMISTMGRPIEMSNEYQKSGNYIIRIKGDLRLFSECSSNIIKVHNWNYYLEDLSSAFLLCYKLESVPFYISEKVTKMSGMFNGCCKLDSDISKWNVSNVKDMSGMFTRCKNFNSNISEWNVSNVKYTSSMFDNCINFNSDLSKWDVSNVTDMSSMFSGCNNFNSNLSKWNVSNVENMFCMFFGCHKFDSDISKWNVSKVGDMDRMFCGCFKFNSDLSKWNMYHFVSTKQMFLQSNVEEEYKPKFTKID